MKKQSWPVFKPERLWKINKDKILTQFEFGRIIQWLDQSGTIADRNLRSAGVDQGAFDIYNSMQNAIKYIILLREELEKRGVDFNGNNLVTNKKEVTKDERSNERSIEHEE